MQRPKEVKTPRIYFAGRINSRWRLGLDIVMSHDDNRRPKVAPQRMTDSQDLEFIYTGPYVYHCHHLCYENGGGTGPFRKDGICRSDKNGQGLGQQGSDVFQRSKDGIKKADYVIAWIYDQECFGTLVQLGIAHALGKKIYIAHSTNIKPRANLWFAFSTATAHNQFLDNNRGIAWCFQMIKRDLKIERPENQAKICFGCWSDECPLRKQKIIHCWKCGQMDVFTKNCPKCGSNKKTKLE